MSIYKFFEHINDEKREVEKALKRYIEAKEEFYSITSIKYTDMPKSKGKNLGFDDLMINIEDLFSKYMEKKKKYDEEYNSCMKFINQLSNNLHKLIIEYSFIDLKKDKDILNSLEDYHNINISYGTLRNEKYKAIKEFKTIINDN